MSKIIVAYATLKSLRGNVKNDGYGIEEKYVAEFHKCLKTIETSLGKSNFDADEFMIPAEEITHFTSIPNYVTGETYNSKVRYCDEPLYFTKLDAALEYIVMIAPIEEKRKMGFE